MPYFYSMDELDRKELVPGIHLRTIWGEKVMLSLVDISPDGEVPEHTHPHEQAGLIMQGAVDFTIGGETRRLRQGDAYVIPGGVPHHVVPVDGPAQALDIFSPPREEYKGDSVGLRAD